MREGQVYGAPHVARRGQGHRFRGRRPRRWNRSESALSWLSVATKSRLGVAELSGSHGHLRCETASRVRCALRSCCIVGDVREEKAGSHGGAGTRESDNDGGGSGCRRSKCRACGSTCGLAPMPCSWPLLLRTSPPRASSAAPPSGTSSTSRST
jgi:hypothetical protein